MNWILVSLLPMVLIRKSPRKAFAAANGQFMLYEAKVYKENWFHLKLKTEKVEDIQTCRLMKSKGYRVHTLLANDQISCRMYSGYREAIQGFSKNVVNYFGGSYTMASAFALITTFGWIAFLLAGRPDLLLYYLLTLMLTRLLVSICSRQNSFLNILFLPFQQLSFVSMVILSITNKLTGRFTWKGRHI
jgi:chlorobactene glucosyltransferase